MAQADKQSQAQAQPEPGSGRQALMERMKTRHPEMDFGDDETLYGTLGADYDDMERRLGEYEGHERELVDMMTVDPRVATMLSAVKRGESLPVTLVRIFGDEFRAALDDPAKLDELAEASKEWTETLARNREYEELYKTNLAKSLSDLEQMQSDEGLTDQQMSEAVGLVASISQSFISGVLTPETIRMALGAINHDRDVQQAGAEGEIRGRNANIDERMRRSRRGDGLPSGMGGRNAKPGGERPQNIFDLANQA